MPVGGASQLILQETDITGQNRVVLRRSVIGSFLRTSKMFVAQRSILMSILSPVPFNCPFVLDPTPYEILLKGTRRQIKFRKFRWESQAMASKKTSDDGKIVIKKYANRRLYNTATSSYVTLDDLCLMVKEGTDFVVFDAKSGEDITRSVLTQIIVEEEAKGTNLLPIGFLRQLIGFYGDSLQGVVPKYLEQSMHSFSENQEKMRGYLDEAFDGSFPFNSMEEMSKRNMVFLEEALSAFNPFQDSAPSPEAETGEEEDPKETGSRSKAFDPLSIMQDQIDALQKQMVALSKGSKPK